MQPVNLTLGQSQLAKLSQSIQRKERPTIKLALEDLKGTTPVHLGKRNHAKVLSALTKGKGVTLALTREELRRNRQQGGFLVPLLTALATPIIGELGKWAVGKLFGGQGEESKRRPRLTELVSQKQGQGLLYGFTEGKGLLYGSSEGSGLPRAGEGKEVEKDVKKRVSRAKFHA